MAYKIVDLGHVPTKEELGNNTGSNEALHQAQKWLKECREKHPRCNQRNKSSQSSSSSSDMPGWVPTRLLDVGLRENDRIRVIDTRSPQVRGQIHRYTTLSHCWGTVEMYELREDQTDPQGNKLPGNKVQLMSEGVELTKLPKNFQHAVQVTRQLNTRYIWIDSLCIVQKPFGEFKVEGQYMHQIYRYSYCNLAAAVSVDSRGGLFRERDPEQIIPVLFKAGSKSSMLGSREWRILPGDLWEDQLLQNPLYKRGWVFQGKDMTL